MKLFVLVIGWLMLCVGGYAHSADEKCPQYKFEAVSASQEASLEGTCIVYTKRSDDVRKNILRSVTHAECKRLKGLFDAVIWTKVTDENELSRGCRDYACSFPCKDHSTCTCYFDDKCR